jgi:hypothetical protein
MDWRISEPAHLLRATRLSLMEGGHFLLNRIAPLGHILHERNLNYVHQACWGMYAAGVDHEVIAGVLDWVFHGALQESGDLYFPEEGPEYRDMQRVYRTLNLARVAAWIDHPMVDVPKVVDRILQYQHASGGVFHYIGDDVRRPEHPSTLGTLNTTAFGHLMIALDMRQQALAAGQWVRQWVQQNREPLSQGQLFTRMTPDGRLVTQFSPNERIGHVVDARGPKQEFWQVGAAMAYLASLYDAMRTRWRCSAEESQPTLDAALSLLDFEATMPLDTYLWPAKGMVGWGAGELMRVLVAHHAGDNALLEKTYRVAERVAMFTFLDNQLPDGGWSVMHSPLSDGIPELDYGYKPLKNVVWVPPEPSPLAATIFMPREEVTGQCLGAMKAIEDGVEARGKEEGGKG